MSRDPFFMFMYASIICKPYAYLIVLLIIFNFQVTLELWRYSNSLPATPAADEKYVCNVPFIISLILEKSFLKKYGELNLWLW